MKEIKEAYHKCEEVIKEHSKTFYQSFSLLPKKKRKATYAIYAFCRFVDDIVDEGTDVQQELATFKQDFFLYIIDKEKTNHFMWLALQDTFQNFPLDVHPFLDMIKGQEMDLTIHRYTTLEQTLHYSYYVASTVGLMLLPILAPKKVDLLKEDAIALGQAMQLTNILRDIHEDDKRGRIYLPQELMVKHGYTENMLHNQIVNESFIHLWEEIAHHAEHLYDKSLQTLHEYPVSARIPLKGAIFLYREILNEIREQHYTVFDQKHFVSKERKKVLLTKIMQ